MSASDAITDLEQAAKRVEDEINVEEARDHGGSQWRRMNLNDARLQIGRALADLKKCVPSENDGAGADVTDEQRDIGPGTTRA